MRIAITGANGFVGRHFVHHATSAGHEAIALHRGRSNGLSPSPLHRNGVAVRRADVLDRAALDGAVADADCVCHLAAAFSEAHAGDDYFHRVNVDGTANVIEAAHAAGIRRFVYCSTAGIYGKRISGIVDETHEPQPWNAYERSKVAAEEEVRRRAMQHGMEYVILRPTQIYGPGDPRLEKLWRNASRGRFPLFGAGDGRRHMIYVGDLAEALLRACIYPGAANHEMIVAGPEAAPLCEILQTIAEVLNRRTFGPRLPLGPMVFLAAVTEDVCRVLKVKAPLHRRRMDFYTSDTEFNCRRAVDVLRWQPKVSLREGIEKTVTAEQRTLGPFSGAVHGVVWFSSFVAAGKGLEAAQTCCVFL